MNTKWQQIKHLLLFPSIFQVIGYVLVTALAAMIFTVSLEIAWHIHEVTQRLERVQAYIEFATDEPGDLALIHLNVERAMILLETVELGNYSNYVDKNGRHVWSVLNTVSNNTMLGTIPDYTSPRYQPLLQATRQDLQSLELITGDEFALANRYQWANVLSLAGLIFAGGNLAVLFGPTLLKEAMKDADAEDELLSGERQITGYN